MIAELKRRNWVLTDSEARAGKVDVDQGRLE